MKAPVQYIDSFSAVTIDEMAEAIKWEQRDAPRREAFFSDLGLDYTYGRGAGMRTYSPMPWPSLVKAVQVAVEEFCGNPFEACFTNYYEGPRDHLGWHADDSPFIDHERPIAVVSLGSAREIWFRPNGMGGDAVEKLMLGPGSLAIMSAGMQQTHQHRIPKHGALCGPRLSLTFRSLLHSV